MNTRNDQNDLSPREAALLLLAARAHVDEEAVDRAVVAVPDSRGARRLKIEQLLKAGDTHAADAMIAQMRLPWPEHPALARLHAQSLLQQGDRILADREILAALKFRPHHVATLVLAGHIARENGDLPTAIERLEHACARRPRCDATKRLLIETLIEAGALARAEQTLATTHAPCHVLDARLLTAQGRLLDAIERLESVPQDAPRARRDEAMSALIELRERVGNVPRLMEMLSEVRNGDHRQLVAAGRAWLAVGSYRTAMMRLFHLRRPGPAQRSALSIMVVAAAMLDRPRLATRALARLQRTAEGADARILADLWRRALSAQSLRDPLHVACDPDAERDVLAPLIESAIDVLGGRPRIHGRVPHAEHLAVLLAASGRPDAAAEVLSRAEPPAVNRTPTVPAPLRRAA